MNKKVLSALLFGALMAGTGTFTSCIDNDEPAGIEELRGAKAELLKAQAAMELADEAYRRAEVANQELLNEAQKLANAAKQIDNEMKELDLKIKEAKTEAEVADYMLQKQQKENALAKLAETFKADMLRAQAETVKAQAELDAAIKAAEVAKLTLTAEQQAQLNTIIAEMNAANGAMTAAHAQVVSMQDELRKALIGDDKTVTLASLEWKLLDAQNGVKAEEIAVADAEKLLALAKDFDTETWAAQLDSLRADSLAATQEKAAAQVDLDAFYVGAEYQAAEKAYADAALKLGKTMKDGKWSSKKNEYIKGEASEAVTEITQKDGEPTLLGLKNAAVADSTAAVTGYYDFEEGKTVEARKEFKIEAYASEPVDKSLALFLDKALKNVNTYDNGVFSYTEGTYYEGAYRKDSADYKAAVAEGTLDTYTASSPAMDRLMTVEGWVNALSTFKADTNGVAWSQLGLDQARKDSADAQKAFDKAKAEWQILVDAVNGKKVTAPTDSVVMEDGQIVWSADVKGAIAAYNDSVASLKAIVADYNALVDSLSKSETKLIADAKTDTVAKLTAAQYADYYATKAKTYYPDKTSTEYKKLDSLQTAKVTDLAKYNDYLTPLAQGDVKNIVDTAIEAWKKTDEAQTKIADAEAKVVEKALAKAYGNNGALAALKGAALAAYAGIQATSTNVATAQTEIQGEYAKYIELLNDDYGQVIAATNLNKYLPANATDTIAVGKAKYFDNGVVDWNVIKNEYGVAAYANMKDAKNEKDSLVISANGTDAYNKFVVTGGTISEAVEANLSVTEIDKLIAIESLVDKSQTAYGSIFDWKKNDQTRLVEVTKEMVKSDAEAKNAKNYNKYGCLGALMNAEEALEIVLAYKDADKLAEQVLAVVKAQFEALKAEIAANSALVAAVEKKADEAWVAYNAGEAMVEKALADRNALTAEAEAEIELLEAIIAEKKAVLESATAQLEALFPGVDGLPGALTTEKLVQAWESKVITAKQELVNAEDAVARAEKEIELFKAGEYSQAYSIEYAEANLEAAQEAYEAAVEYYEFVAAQFKSLLAAYSK